MIIIIGPDHTGKTTLSTKLAQEFELPYYHYSYKSSYEDYLIPLCNLSLTKAVLDRWMFCEIPYSQVMGREPLYTLKQFHNIILTTLIQRPVILFGVNKPSPEIYGKDQYMGYEKWDQCYDAYRVFLRDNNIPYFDYDFDEGIKISDLLVEINSPEELVMHSFMEYEKTDWWRPMWKAGYGCTGSPDPTYLIVAERIGPLNSHNIPFEAGPTGYMLTDLINYTKTPLGSIAITNMIKIPATVNRSSPEYSRPVNQNDLDLFRIELKKLNPAKVIFMGSESRRAGIPICKELGIMCDSIVHLGALKHKGIVDIKEYSKSWVKALSLEPKPREKLQ